MRGRMSLGVVWICAAASACAGASSPQPAAQVRGAQAGAATSAASAGAASTAVAAGEPAPEVAAAAGATPAPAGPRLTSKGYTSFIWRRPKVETLFIGYVRHGQSVALKSTETVPGVGCPGGFYAI
jgi:hypothetical protein